MGSKHPPQGEELDAAAAGDLMELTPLGAGQEVGRSCLYLTFKGKTIMVRLGPLPPAPPRPCSAPSPGTGTLWSPHAHHAA